MGLNGLFTFIKVYIARLMQASGGRTNLLYIGTPRFMPPSVDMAGLVPCAIVCDAGLTEKGVLDGYVGPAGVVTQVASMVGSLLMFPLVNVYGVFRATPGFSCPQPS